MKRELLKYIKMDQSYNESDLSMSPSQILERLQMLRQLQLLQRGKLQKQQISYQDSSEISSNITEIVSHFSNSTSYNTFRSLLHSNQDSSNETTPRQIGDSSRKLVERDFIDGVSVLNLSQEPEFLLNTPKSSKSKTLSESDTANVKSSSMHSTAKSLPNKQISLDEMPILTPKKNFEALIAEKLQTEESSKKDNGKPNKNIFMEMGKRQFLKKGEGMSRFGLQKKDLVIQHTKSLPWHKKNVKTQQKNINGKKNVIKPKVNLEDVEVQIRVSKPSTPLTNNDINHMKVSENSKSIQEQKVVTAPLTQKNDSKSHFEQQEKKKFELPKGKHPLQVNKGKTWAAVLTKEQDDFLKQLKQSEYYKNYNSPAKSVTSDMSYDSNVNIHQDRETAEQKMFELLERKVTHESFNIENSFINRFLRRTKLECSGESTPLVMQRCLTKNPDLLHIHHGVENDKSNIIQCEVETCHSECMDCAETCSSISSNCSCITVEQINTSCTSCKSFKINNNKKEDIVNKSKENSQQKVAGNQNKKEKKCQNNAITDDTDDMKSNMAEMNAKLVATSELLKERLCELEDEIETFRRENASLSKIREEIDLERQNFFEEKAAFEQKFNEEKILSEYYIAEEKEKLTKQKQLYERYVRDMRGRLNKKEKDEVLNLKKEINELKDEIRLKDAKSTSTIARLRNQLKIIEKEKKSLQDEVDNLKKENRRIQHSNDVTRRLTNLKYLEQINKKLTDITTKESQSEVNLDPDVKYRAFEIEKQSRGRRAKQSQIKGVRPRAKSVPNLNVTSRYAKYFSQKDSLSVIERNKTLNLHELNASPNESIGEGDKVNNLENSYSNSEKSLIDIDDENNLEKIYIDRFQNSPPKSKRSIESNSSGINDNSNIFFIQKSKSNYQTNNSEKDSIKSKNNISDVNNKYRNLPQELSMFPSESIKSNYSTGTGVAISNSYNLSKSPTSITSNHSSSHKLPTVINKNHYEDTRLNVTPEPSTSKSSLTKTNLNPIEIIKPDGSRELKFPNGNVKFISADGKYSKFLYYNGDVKENFYNEGRIKYFYSETKTFHTTHADGLEVLEFADGQVEKRYKDGSSEIRLPNGSIRYFDPKNEHVREEWRFPDGAALTISANGEQRIVFSNGQIEVHAKDHKRREFPDGTVKLVYNDGTAETRYASGRVRIKDKHGNLIMDSACS